jgi:hypothetical protein
VPEIWGCGEGDSKDGRLLGCDIANAGEKLDEKFFRKVVLSTESRVVTPHETAACNINLY